MEQLRAQLKPEIQKTIGEIAGSLFDSPHAGEYSAEARRIAEHLKAAIADQHEIVNQVAIFAGIPDEEQPLIALGVLEVLDLPPSVVIESLAPHLETDNINVTSFARGWFRSHDHGGPDLSPLRPVNYADYADYAIKKFIRNEHIPNGFVEYLFERSVGRALLVFDRAALSSVSVDALPQSRAGLGTKDVQLAEHMISNALWLKKRDFSELFREALPGAKQQLSKLAEQEQWWCSLYVAEIMRRHPEFRQPEVLEKLSHDDNELVSKSAKSAID